MPIVIDVHRQSAVLVSQEMGTGRPVALRYRRIEVPKDRQGIAITKIRELIIA